VSELSCKCNLSAPRSPCNPEPTKASTTARGFLRSAAAIMSAINPTVNFLVGDAERGSGSAATGWGTTQTGRLIVRAIDFAANVLGAVIKSKKSAWARQLGGAYSNSQTQQAMRRLPLRIWRGMRHKASAQSGGGTNIRMVPGPASIGHRAEGATARSCR